MRTTLALLAMLAALVAVCLASALFWANGQDTASLLTYVIGSMVVLAAPNVPDVCRVLFRR